MTSYVEIEAPHSFDFSIEEVTNLVMNRVLDTEDCPYEACINLTLTDDEGIWQLNREFRNIDRATDVLSFPNLEFETPGDFSYADTHEADCFDPESGELVLGDIIISVDHVIAQAANYGHSLKREFAFLAAHSMLHLCGYDHMEPEEAKIMEQKQEEVLQALGITRE